METIVNDGQIKYDSEMGKMIEKYSQDSRFSRYLEIGTWNGWAVYEVELSGI